MEISNRFKEAMKKIAVQGLPIEGFRVRCSMVTWSTILSEQGAAWNADPQLVLGLPVDFDNTMSKGSVVLRWEVVV